MLVRSWNLFHGNTVPPRRRSYLAEIVRLASEGRPDLLLLQEVPVWALSRLGTWTGMQAVGDIARRPRLPSPIAHAITALHSGLFRSLLTGQANATLLRPEIDVVHHSVLVINPGKWPGVGAGERRICQVVRVQTPAGRTVLLGHLHASQHARSAAEQAVRVAEHLNQLSKPPETAVLAGDFNATPSLGQLGFSGTAAGIDHILVRGAEASPLRVWPDERRRLNGCLLSDHAPVELDIDL